MRIGYADPPYPGMSHFYKDHPDYGGEVDHGELVEQLREYDAWLLHTAATTLREVWNLCPDARCGIWVKPFASWKKNVYPAYAWEPVLFSGGCNAFGEQQTARDWVAESITLKRGLTGAKPEAFCFWVFDLLNVGPGDTLVDLFPGSGAVTEAWAAWQRRLSTTQIEMAVGS